MDKKIIADHNLTQDEYGRIVRLIGREPNLTELGIFSTMWSEHCSYKSSKVHLKKLPTTGKRVIQGPGENAGILDIGGGQAVVFKIESHNHPSYIEPFQGAATGVGGILRDIFTMGARPIAILDSLRFGPLSEPHNRSIMEGVVSGISSYGNSIGVPTVGGEVSFHEGYSANPLVNVFCLGIAAKEKIFYARAGEPGNYVLYVGAKTGRDGIHGATMASAEFGKETGHKRPNVQVGDPFREKLLLEACLEVMGRDLIIGIQDMGAAGLTCSTTEMAAKSGLGMDVDLDLVPQREEGMTPYEIMLSESQERMLLVCTEDTVAEVKAVFAKWDLDAVVIGRITKGGRLTAKAGGKPVIDLPLDAVIDLCPVYERPGKLVEPRPPLEIDSIPVPPDFNEALLMVLGSPTIADKEWVFRQYDYMVQTNTALVPGADAAVLRIKGLKKALAATLDGNARYTALDAEAGSQIAVAEACRNLACVGARPIGVTNCLNFGNPEKPEVMGQFESVIAGMSAACRVFGIPVTGGNVSFYNDTEGESISPTPVLGIVGLIEDIDKVVRPGFRAEGEAIVLLGRSLEELGGSEYLKVIHGSENGPAPRIDLAEEKRVQELCLESIDKGWLRSAHDVSDGGLAVCLAECCFSSPTRIGGTVSLEDEMHPHALVFGESQSRILVTVEKKNADKLLRLARKRRVEAALLGETGGRNIVIRHRNQTLIDLPVAKAFTAWKTAIPDYFRTR